MSAKTKLIKIGLPLLILVLGFAAMRLMIMTRSEPRREVRENPGALVEVLKVVHDDRQIQVQGTGTVTPRQEIALTPQVSGRVTKVAAEFVAGGFFSKGDMLFKIEDADYRLAVEKARAALANAEYELAAMAGQARIARQEWERLDLGRDEEPNPLVLYEPQMKNAQAALLSAQAGLRQAELDLERTLLRAPFDAVVLSETVDLGQYVRAGTSVAALAGTRQAEIVVPLPLEELAWLSIPRQGERMKGSPAFVQLTTGEKNYRWSGRVVRRLGNVDPQGRMARLVVAVSDPYGLQKEAGPRPVLSMGSFVQVSLQGAVLTKVVTLPASALRDGDSVWIMNDGHLKTREVEVLRRARNEVIIGKGLNSGDLVVLTNLSGAAEGMKLRPAEGQPVTNQHVLQGEQTDE